MKPDPKVRKDRRCANPGCKNPLTTVTAQHRRYGSATDIQLDPFCSSVCCKRWHKVETFAGPVG